MIGTAYNLSNDFVEELARRIELLVESAQQSSIFGDIFNEVPFIPNAQILAQIIDAVTWTSFSTEEGKSVIISITLLPSEDTFDTFKFDQPIRFDVKNLVKLGAALENPRADIGVWHDQHGDLTVWGFKVRSLDTWTPNLCVEALSPGKVLITFGGKSLAALIGNKAVFIDNSHFTQKIFPQLSLDTSQQENKMLLIMRFFSILTVARKMREHTRGGTLLVVSNSQEWRNSIGTPLPYTGGANFIDHDFDVAQKPSLMTAFADFFTSMVKDKQFSERENLRRMSDQIDQQCRHIARLTAVDGALAMSLDRFVYCFGAKIIQTENQVPPNDIRIYKPVEKDEGIDAEVIDLGGTRHQSAAQFVHAQPGTIAVVVSQDGDITFITTAVDTLDLIAIQLAEFPVIPEGLGAVLWRYSEFIEMNLL